MNRTILQLLAVTFCFAVVHSLNCYQCKLGFGTLCVTSQTTCGDGEQCFSGKGKAANVLDIMTKGCLAIANCNKTTEENFSTGSNTTLYSLTKTCCNTDLCNSAPGLPGALQLALATVAAVFAANALV